MQEIRIVSALWLDGARHSMATSSIKWRETRWCKVRVARSARRRGVSARPVDEGDRHDPTGSVPPVATMVDQEGSASPSTESVPQCQPQRGTTGRRRLVFQFEVDPVTSEEMRGRIADKQMKMNQSTWVFQRRVP